MTPEIKDDYFIASLIITIVIITVIFGGCLYIRYMRGDNSYASIHNINKIVEAKK